MPKYFPIDVGVEFDCVHSDLHKIDWGVNHLSADFILPGDGDVIRVTFTGTTIVRLLDDFPLSTELDPSPDEGLVRGHMAYRVEGARFADDQSTVWLEIHAPVTHFRFITGWACMDVLSPREPTFSVVLREPRETA